MRCCPNSSAARLPGKPGPAVAISTVAVRVGEIDALEVDAIHHRRDAQPGAEQPLAEGELRLLVGDGEGVVVRLARAQPCRRLAVGSRPK